jgi:DNA-binding protein HU-beta
MTKSELIAALAEKADVSNAAAARVFGALEDAVLETLKVGDDVTLGKLGTLTVEDRPERAGRNPATGETITIAAKKAVKFKVGKAAKDAVN